MNKISLHILALTIILLPFKAIAQSDCFEIEDNKVIGISNESVFGVRQDCTAEEIELAINDIPKAVFKDHRITDLKVRKATIEEAIELLKKAKSKTQKTEDLIKLIDFLPTAMPLTVKILEFQMLSYDDEFDFDSYYINVYDLSFYFNLKSAGIVLIDSENVVIEGEKTHKFIAIPNI